MPFFVDPRMRSVIPCVLSLSLVRPAASPCLFSTNPCPSFTTLQPRMPSCPSFLLLLLLLYDKSASFLGFGVCLPARHPSGISFSEIRQQEHRVQAVEPPVRYMMHARCSTKCLRDHPISDRIAVFQNSHCAVTLAGYIAYLYLLIHYAFILNILTAISS